MNDLETLQRQIIAEHVAREDYKRQQIEERLPSWAVVSDAVDAAFSNTAQRTLIKRLCRVVYWLAKNRAD